MPRITLDNLEYNTENLSDAGKAQLTNLQFVEAQLQKLKKESEVYLVAHRAYVLTLKEEIEKSGILPVEKTST